MQKILGSKRHPDAATFESLVLRAIQVDTQCRMEDTEAMEAFARRACSGPLRTAEAALRALKPHLLEDSANACLVALRVCNYCVKNSNGLFLDALTSDKWRRRLVQVGTGRRDNQVVVTEALAMYLLEWADLLPNTRWGRMFFAVFSEIRNRGQIAATTFSTSPANFSWGGGRGWKPGRLPSGDKGASAVAPALATPARTYSTPDALESASVAPPMVSGNLPRTLSGPSPGVSTNGGTPYGGDAFGYSRWPPPPAHQPQQAPFYPHPPTSFQSPTIALPTSSASFPPPPQSSVQSPPLASSRPPPPAYNPPPPPTAQPLSYMELGGVLQAASRGPLPSNEPQPSSAHWTTSPPLASAQPSVASSFGIRPTSAISIQPGRAGNGPGPAHSSYAMVDSGAPGFPPPVGQPSPSREDAELQWALQASRDQALLEAQRAAEHARAALREVELQQEKAALMLSLDTLAHHSRLLEVEGMSEEQMVERAKLLSLHELEESERSAAAAAAGAAVQAGYGDQQPTMRNQQWATVQTDTYLSGGRMTVPHAPDSRPVGGTFQPSFGGLGTERDDMRGAATASTLSAGNWNMVHRDEMIGVAGTDGKAGRKPALGRVLPDSFQGVGRADDAGGAALPPGGQMLASGELTESAARRSLWSARDGSQDGDTLDGQASAEGKEREPPEIPPEILFWVDQVDAPTEGGVTGGGKGGIPAPPRPPPPPPPPRGAGKPAAEVAKDSIQRAPEVLELYRELNRPKGIPSRGSRVISPATSTPNGDGQVARDAGGAGVQAELKDKILGRSTYWKEVQDDVERHGPRIRRLSAAVTHVSLPDMDKVCAFVDAMEAQLAVLCDERAVLKSFEWPEAKMDALREAASTHRSLQGMEREMQHLSAPGGPAMILPFSEYKAAVLRTFENVQARTDAVLRQQDALTRRLREHNIPDVFRRLPSVRQAAAGLAQAYMERAVEEAKKLCSGADSQQGQAPLAVNERQRERAQSVLIAAVRLGFRAHQFAGGFTPGGLAAFNELSSLLQALSVQSEGGASAGTAEQPLDSQSQSASAALLSAPPQPVA